MGLDIGLIRQNMQAGAASQAPMGQRAGENPQNNQFGSITGSVKGIDQGLFTVPTSNTPKAPVDLGLVSRMDQLDQKGPDTRDSQHGQKLYLMG